MAEIQSKPVPGPDRIEHRENRYKLFIQLGAGLALWIVIFYWLQPAADFLTYQLFGLSASSRLGSSVAFFLYDAPKVILLLVLVIFIIGVIRSFFTPERTRGLLAGRREFAGNIIVQTLMEKGAALGTSLAFMMAVVGLSLPETIILRRVLKWQLLAVFIGVVAVGIIIVGYLFNIILIK